MVIVRLYDVVITHSREVEPRRRFRHRAHTWLVDLDDLPGLPRPLRSLIRFDARDHLGDPHRSIRENLDRWLALQGVDLRGGRVLMLAGARVLGHAFNPITVFWCHRPDGSQECAVAEVHNTYGERHCYLLRPDDDGVSEVDKRFYVSPFQPSEGHYRMRLEPPGDRLRVHVELVHDGRTALRASMTGRRRPTTPAQLVRTALRHPLAPRRISALIRRHGVALLLRRAPRTRRIPHLHQEGVR
ncbi:DUF1365 domain-containing protein [Saccharopolyspora endophytica]|uniref:DUF1365 domain-containing protein n=1 Tax=Saccharopolyspora endophytica TaxID=543886 RepID=A0ABS5DFE7_9PSEU|nr:DUF1365 domain-containing protein [Saccharopolyspora endophytica]MBQ0925004.1 DUF1365 domain-containing protein [Saccharopolyspora endophytica]